jgi:hypothetical protein
MSALILDAGAFIAVEQNDRETVLRLRRAQQAGLDLRSNGAVVAQVWRHPDGRQARLARLLKSVDVRAVDDGVGREAGVLLGRAGTRDAIDGSVVVIAASGDRILTSNPDDITRLVAASGRPVLVVRC